MTGRRSRMALTGLVLALCVAMGGTGAADAAKKGKKKRKATPINVTRVVNALVPDGTATSNGVLTSAIEAGAQFKGLRVRDVNVTLTTAGNTPPAAADLDARLIAPNGATSELFEFGDLSGQNIGPLTYDDESAAVAVGATSFDQYGLPSPYIGTVHPSGPPLSVMDDGPARGTWTLALIDPGTNDTSNLVSWRLNVTTGRPYLTK